MKASEGGANAVTPKKRAAEDGRGKDTESPTAAKGKKTKAGATKGKGKGKQDSPIGDDVKEEPIEG